MVENKELTVGRRRRSGNRQRGRGVEGEEGLKE